MRKIDWGEVLLIITPIFFAVLFGVLLALTIGHLFVYLVFELISSYAN